MTTMHLLKKNPHTKIIVSAILFLLLVGLISTAKFALATVANSASGWAWGGTTSTDGAYQGMGWISFNDTTAGSGGGSYGVNVPASNGPLSGYAWSDNYGWISFNSSDLAGCPAGASAPATRSGNNVTGSARILAIRDAGTNAGGFDGCISLSGAGYGLTVVGNNLTGYAWSGDLGWIDLNTTGVTLANGNLTFTATPSTISVGNTSTLKWTITGAATRCVALSNGGGWTAGDVKNSNTGDNTEIVSPTTNTTYTIECFNGASSIGAPSVSVVVNTPPATLTPGTCTIPTGANTCTAKFSWTVTAGTAPYSTINETNGAACVGSGNANRTNENCTLNYGNNVIELRDASSPAPDPALASAAVVARCVDGSSWDVTSSACTLTPVPPSILISADPKIIRSGDKSRIIVDVTHAGDVTCEFINADTPSPMINHNGTPPTQTHSAFTKELSSTKIVTVKCYDNLDPAATEVSDDIRIEVIPMLQEV